MIINYNLEKLQAVLNDFCLLTGIRIALCDPQGRCIARSIKQDDFCQLMQIACGDQGCRLSDATLAQHSIETGKPQLHRCHRGLLDMCVPVIAEGASVGYLIMGRIRTEAHLPDALSVALPKHLHPQAQELYRDLPYYTEQQARSAANLAAILASYILAENLILAQKNEETERLISYIDDHLCEPLHIERMCRDMHVSKTMLYRLFSTNMGCGVNHYITARRLETAMNLLARTSLPVGEICERVGIYNYTYFCRLFKKRVGMTPLQYRKNR